MRSQRVKRKGNSCRFLATVTFKSKVKQNVGRLARIIKRKYPFLDVHTRKGRNVIVKQYLSDLGDLWYKDFRI